MEAIPGENVWFVLVVDHVGFLFSWFVLRACHYLFRVMSSRSAVLRAGVVSYRGKSWSIFFGILCYSATTKPCCVVRVLLSRRL